MITYLELIYIYIYIYYDIIIILINGMFLIHHDIINDNIITPL